MFVYADNAATTAMSKAAIDAMTPAMHQLYGNPSSLHQKGREANYALMDARDLEGHRFEVSTEDPTVQPETVLEEQELQQTLSHELTHHMEGRSGLHALEDKDEAEMDAWREKYGDGP